MNHETDALAELKHNQLQECIHKCLKIVDFQISNFKHNQLCWFLKQMESPWCDKHTLQGHRQISTCLGHWRTDKQSNFAHCSLTTTSQDPTAKFTGEWSGSYSNSESSNSFLKLVKIKFWWEVTS